MLEPTRGEGRAGCALTALLCVATWSTPGDAKPKPRQLGTAEIVARVDAVYAKIRSYRARFLQRFQLTAYNKTKSNRGSVVFLRPGKMSWRYTSNANRVVSDGKLIRVYVADNKQLFEQPLAANQYAGALAFLLGGGKLAKAFELRKAKSSFPRGYVLVGKPKKPTPAYRTIAFYVDAQTFHIRRVVMLDTQGNRNRFDFSAPKVNMKVAPSEFRFRPPPGTQVVRP